MVFHGTFNNISVISWRSVLLAEETGVIGENLLQVTDKLDHIMLYQVYHGWTGYALSTFMMIGTDCIGSYKSNNHTIMTMTAPNIQGMETSIENLLLYTKSDFLWSVRGHLSLWYV
jgi:hypothetical protein